MKLRLNLKPTDERGAAALEIAILMPLFLALILLIFQVALWWHARQVADVIAGEVLDQSQVVNSTEIESVANSTARAILNDVGGFSDLRVEILDVGPDRVGVEVSGCSPQIFAFDIFTTSSTCWSVRSRAIGPTEQFFIPPSLSERQ